MATTEAEPQAKDMPGQDVDGKKSSAGKKPLDDDTPDTARPKKKAKTRPHHLLHQATLRKPSWTYFHLELFSPSTNEPLDILTAKRYLTSALQRFLGLHGAATSVDIIKLDGKELWIRVPREDAPAVHEAVSGWTGDGVKWLVKGRDEWLSKLTSGDGQDLFKV